MRVAVLVLGELGYSPRMLYHALALAGDIAEVDLIGFGGAEIPAAVREHPDIRIHALGGPAHRRRHAWPRPLFLVHAALRAVLLAARTLWCLLVKIARPDAILIQNPPAIPTLAVALVAARLRRARLVVDWHNFGWAMFAMRLGRRHWLVRVARRYERAFGRRADAHFCVSGAMREELESGWGIEALVLRDRPAAHFAPTPEPARTALRERIAREAGLHASGPFEPALVVSATSWSADEDFSLVLDAAERCDALLGERAAAGQAVPRAILLVTGRGPGREAFEERASRLALERVHIHTAWFGADEYPAVLGAADVGISVHRSASGLDLPMKIADMFGSGLPVCAFDYAPCLAEVLTDGEDGLLFSNAGELAEHLATLLDDMAGERRVLERLRRGAGLAAAARWHDEWTVVARPVFER